MIYKLRKKFITVAMISVVVVLFAMIGTINVLNYVNVCRNADQRLEILTNNGGTLPFGPGQNGPTDGEEFDGKTPPEGTEGEPPSDLGPGTGSDSAASETAASSGGTNSGPAAGDGSAASETAAPSGDANSGPAAGDGSDTGIGQGNGNDGQTGLGQRLTKFFGNDLSGETMFDTRYFSVTLESDGNASETDTSNIASITEDTAIEYAQALFEKGKEHGFYKSYRYSVIHEEETVKYIFLNCEREFSSFRSFLFTSLLISVIGCALVYVLVVILSKQVVRPIAENYKKQKQFITDAGHELKTPLTIIDAYAEIIEMDDEGNEYAAGIKNQVARLTELTNNLIFLSKTEEDGSSLNMEDFSLTDALEDLLGPYRTMAEKDGKTLTARIAESVQFHGDEYSIRRLITLLLDNALKYSSDHGVIIVDLERAGQQIRFSVENTVDDIEIGNLDVLFERFYRRDASRNSETGGSGIGLSTAKAIVDAHKGSIHARGLDNEHFKITVTFKK